jgi:hypothetical protein
MRVLVLFFFSLCFFVLRADAHQNRICYSFLSIEKQQQAKSAKIDQEVSVVACESKLDETDYLIDVDDEEEEFAFARKYILVTTYFSISELSPPNDFYSYKSGDLPFCEHLGILASDKYLRQRTLRL